MINIDEINPLPFLENVSFPNVLPHTSGKVSLHPLILAQNREGKFFLIDGYKRFNFFKKEKKKFPLFSVYKENIDENNEELLLDYVRFNLERCLNEIEISNLIFISEKYFKNDELIKKIFKLLNLKPTIENLNKFKKLSKLTKECKKMYIENFLNKNVAIKISLFENSEQEIIIKLFKHLRLNGNKQKKTFNMLLDLSKRNSMKIKSILEKYFYEIFDSPFSKELEESFFNSLLEKHSPNYYEFQKKFLKFKNSIIHKDTGINILNPSNFENTNYKLEIFFKNPDEMENKLKHILENMKNRKLKNEFKELFE